MTVTISKQFSFEAAHSLAYLPPTHKCHHLHGHGYGVTVHVKGKLDPALHWVVDYADISAAWEPVFKKLDHKNLNEVLPMPTTAENLAIWIYDQLRPALPQLYAVDVQETATSNARYQPEG